MVYRTACKGTAKRNFWKKLYCTSLIMLYYQPYNRCICTGNKFGSVFLYSPTGWIIFCCTGSTAMTQSPHEETEMISMELGLPWAAPFYTRSCALPFYSTGLPWRALEDGSICCPAVRRPWGDLCTDSVETEPSLCCHFQDHYVLWWTKILWVFLLVLNTLPHVCSTLLLRQFQTCWKQMTNCLTYVYVVSWFHIFSLQFLCWHCSLLKQTKETFDKQSREYTFHMKCKEKQP